MPIGCVRLKRCDGTSLDRCLPLPALLDHPPCVLNAAASGDPADPARRSAEADPLAVAEQTAGLADGIKWSSDRDLSSAAKRAVSTGAKRQATAAISTASRTAGASTIRRAHPACTVHSQNCRAAASPASLLQSVAHFGCRLHQMRGGSADLAASLGGWLCSRGGRLPRWDSGQTLQLCVPGQMGMTQGRSTAPLDCAVQILRLRLMSYGSAAGATGGAVVKTPAWKRAYVRTVLAKSSAEEEAAGEEEEEEGTAAAATEEDAAEEVRQIGRLPDQHLVVLASAMSCGRTFVGPTLIPAVPGASTGQSCCAASSRRRCCVQSWTPHCTAILARSMPDLNYSLR